MYTDETPSPKSTEADEAAEFDQICHQGWAWSWANLRVKIYRFTILIIKQVYLIFMTLSLPTNHLMVSSSCRRESRNPVAASQQSMRSSNWCVDAGHTQQFAGHFAAKASLVMLMSCLAICCRACQLCRQR